MYPGTVCRPIIHGTSTQVEALIPGFNLKDACTLHRWYLDSYKGQMADDSTLKLSMNTNSAYIGLTHPMNPVDGGGDLGVEQEQLMSMS